MDTEIQKLNRRRLTIAIEKASDLFIELQYMFIGEADVLALYVAVGLVDGVFRREIERLTPQVAKLLSESEARRNNENPTNEMDDL